MTYGNTLCNNQGVNYFYFTGKVRMELSKNIHYGILNDFYGDLLTPYQSEMLHLYYDLDNSLAEIAEDMSITRQGARDVIMRANKKLEQYEAKLGLAKKRGLLITMLDELMRKLNDLNKDEIMRELINIKAEAEEI